jgi:hypothetical protein
MVRSGFPKIKVQVGVPGVVAVGTDDVASLIQSRRFVGGPFLIVARDQGLALDTGFGSRNWDEPHLWAAHAFPQQMWILVGTKWRKQHVIQSVSNGLVLDARRETNEGRHPLMWERHDAAWQRWELEPTGDGMAFFIRSPHTGHVLDAGGPDRQNRDKPVLWGKHGAMHQQFLVLVPTGTENSPIR